MLCQLVTLPVFFFPSFYFFAFLCFWISGKIRQKLRALDIMPKDIDELWDILDEGKGEPCPLEWWEVLGIGTRRAMLGNRMIQKGGGGRTKLDCCQHVSHHIYIYMLSAPPQGLPFFEYKNQFNQFICKNKQTHHHYLSAQQMYLSGQSHQVTCKQNMSGLTSLLFHHSASDQSTKMHQAKKTKPKTKKNKKNKKNEKNEKT